MLCTFYLSNVDHNSDRNLKKYDEGFGPDFKGSDGKALTVMATFDYEAQNMDELTFTKGKLTTKLAAVP